MDTIEIYWVGCHHRISLLTVHATWLSRVAMTAFPLLVIVYALAATVWTGGHLVLDLGLLPVALRERSAERIRGFEATF